MHLSTAERQVPASLQSRCASVERRENKFPGHHTCCSNLPGLETDSVPERGQTVLRS